MARVTITIEDLLHGVMRVTASPSAESLIKALKGGHKLSKAEKTAFTCLDIIWRMSKMDGPDKITLPSKAPRGLIC
jgi:hypothetical protein